MLRCALERLNAGIQICVQLPLACCRGVSAVLQRFDPATKLIALPLDGSDLLRRIHETLIAHRLFENLRAAVELVHFGQYRIVHGLQQRAAASNQDRRQQTQQFGGSYKHRSLLAGVLELDPAILRVIRLVTAKSSWALFAKAHRGNL